MKRQTTSAEGCTLSIVWKTRAMTADLPVPDSPHSTSGWSAPSRR